jgi:hypothetical protein
MLKEVLSQGALPDSPKIDDLRWRRRRLPPFHGKWFQSVSGLDLPEIPDVIRVEKLGTEKCD